MLNLSKEIYVVEGLFLEIVVELNTTSQNRLMS